MSAHRHALVLLNRSAGSVSHEVKGALVDRVRAAFHGAGLHADIQVVPGPGLRERTRQALGASADIVVAGGGDGTVSTVAGVLAGTSRRLGVLPLGTLNHFAKDLGLPLLLDEAVQVIARGAVHLVDVGEVNGRVFINNSSIGIYPHIVRQRVEYQLRAGMNKWLALIPACLSVFRRYPLLEARVVTGSETEHLFTPLLFVGNNKYETHLLTVRSRLALDRGELCLYLVKGQGRFTLVRLALLSLAGRLNQDRDFRGLCRAEFRVDTPRRSISIAADGEIFDLRPPLRYRIRPRALQVIVSGKTGI